MVWWWFYILISVSVAKPLIVDGSAKSHELSLVFDQNSLQKLEPPLVLQSLLAMVLGHMCFTCKEHMSLFSVIGLSFDKTHFICIWVDLGCV